MSRRALVPFAGMVLAFAFLPATAADSIPETSGFSGFVLGGGTYWNVASNLFFDVSPIVLKDVGHPRIDSIFEAPSSNTSPGLLVGGEVSYTFSSTRTQLYLGSRFEDLLRLDPVVGIGVRQQAGSAGIIAASFLFTPLTEERWADPYVEGVERRPTDFSFPGFRLRWSGIFGTGLEVTITDRFYNFNDESSGDWLVSEGRLDPADQPLLDRDGDSLQIQALYRIDVNRHRLEPAVRWAQDRHDGAAVANTGFGFQLTYLYRSPRVVVDANVLYGFRKAKETNPIYGQAVDGDRLGVGLTAFIPLKTYSSSSLSFMVGGEMLRQDANVDFFDSELGMVLAGVIWRHVRK